MQIGSLFMALGFDVDDKKLGEFDGKINALRGGITGLAGVAAAGVGALTAMAVSGARSAQDMVQFSKQTDISTEALQRFNNVATALNPTLTLEDSKAQLIAFRNAVVNAEWSEGETGLLNMILGENIAGMSPEDVMQSFMRASQRNDLGVSKQKLQQLMVKGGLDERFIGMTRLSESEYAKLEGRRDVRKESDIKNLAGLDAEIAEAKHESRLLFDKLASDFGTVLSDILGGFRQVSEEVRGVSKEGETFSEVMGSVKTDISEWYGELMSGIRDTNAQLGLEKIREDNPDRYNRLMQDKYLEDRGATKNLEPVKNSKVVNNINIESTADAQDLVESVFNEIESRADRDLIGELPNTSLGGIR